MGWPRKARAASDFCNTKVTTRFQTHFRARLLAGRAASCRRRHVQTALSAGLCRSPGLEEEVVGDVGLRVQKGLQVALPVYKLTLPQRQAPLLDVHNHWIRQVALHHKQRAENHLEEQASTRSDKLGMTKCN